MNNTIDPKALFSLGYGLYVITASSGGRTSGMIGNVVAQVSNDRVAVSMNKKGFTASLVGESGRLNVNVLDETAPFSLFQRFGFASGRDTDKFEGLSVGRTANGLPALSEHCNAILSLRVTDTVDLGSHWLFVCEVEASETLSGAPTMSYAYYQANVKPKPQPKPAPAKTEWVCEICGYVYEGEELPPDFICPICNHPASDFRKR